MSLQRSRVSWCVLKTLTTNERTHVDFMIIDEVAIELLNRILSGFSGLIMDITISFRVSLFIGGNLARQDITKHTEGIEQTLVVYRRCQVLDKYIADTRFAKRRISLGPHDTTRSTFDVGEIHRVQGTFGVLNIMKIHVGIPQRTTSHGITANANGGDGTHTVEEFELHFYKENEGRIKK